MKNINNIEQISSSDPLDLAIWKYMSDRVGRSLRTIGEGLAVHGFDQRTVRDRVVTLFKGGGKSWFVRKQRHNDPIFLLKKDCKRPVYPTSTKLEPVIASAFQPQLPPAIPSTGNKVIRDLIENNPAFKNLDLYNAAKVVTHIAVKYFEHRTFKARDMCSVMTGNIPEEFEAARGTMHPIEFTQSILQRAITDGGIVDVTTPVQKTVGEPARYISVVYYKRHYPTQSLSEDISTVAIKRPNPFPMPVANEQKYALACETIYSVIKDKVFTEVQLVEMLLETDDKSGKKVFINRKQIEKDIAVFLTSILKEKSHRIFDIHLIDPSVPKLPIQYVAADLYDQKVDEHIANMNTHSNKEEPNVTTTTINKTDSSKEAVIKAVQQLGSANLKQIFAYLKEVGHPITYGGASGQLSRLSSFEPSDTKPLMRVMDEEGTHTLYSYPDLNTMKEPKQPEVTTTEDVIREDALNQSEYTTRREQLASEINSTSKEEKPEDIQAVKDGLLHPEQIEQCAVRGVGSTGLAAAARPGPVSYQFNPTGITTNTTPAPLFEHVIRIKGKVMNEEEISSILQTYLMIPPIPNPLVVVNFTIAGVDLSYDELKEIAMKIEAIKNEFTV